MTMYGWLIFALWLILVAYWVLTPGAARRSVCSRWIWWREIAVRLGFFALIVQAVRVAMVNHRLPDARLYALNTNTLAGIMGLLVSVYGVGLAILGRACLNRNWRMPMSNKKRAALVTTGPYARVRHPIYGGMLLAMVGSAFGQSVLWLLPLIVYGPHFILSARREEKQLSAEFPEDYPAYMKRTKMLLPFVL